MFSRFYGERMAASSKTQKGTGCLMAAPSDDVHPCCHGRVYEVISAARSVSCRHAGAAGILGGERLAYKRPRDHCVDLGGVKSALVMTDQGLREREHDPLVPLDDRERFLIVVLDEGRGARVGGQMIRARALAA
jgi:hypothetical protein